MFIMCWDFRIITHTPHLELIWAELKAWFGTINKIYNINDFEYYGELILKGTTEDKLAGYWLLIYTL
jgi:hypothetical protein